MRTPKTQKVHEYFFDAKTGERFILTPSPYCRFCFKEFKNGDGAYYADKENFIVCRDCLIKGGGVSIFHDGMNNFYCLGTIKIKKSAIGGKKNGSL